MRAKPLSYFNHFPHQYPRLESTQRLIKNNFQTSRALTSRLGVSPVSDATGARAQTASKTIGMWFLITHPAPIDPPRSIGHGPESDGLVVARRE